MYPRNAVSPPEIAIGAVVQISDGAVQTSGVSISVKAKGGAAGAGGGTTAYGTGGSVYYTPTQAETNYEEFLVEAYKTGCIPVAATIVTTASAEAGKVLLQAAQTGVTIPTVTTVTNDVGVTQGGADKVWNSTTRTLSAFSFTVAANLTQILGSAITETAGQIAAAFKAFFNIADPTGTVNRIPNVTLVDATTTNTDMRGTDGANTTEPDNVGVAAIKAKTDSLPTNPATEQTAAYAQAAAEAASGRCARIVSATMFSPCNWDLYAPATLAVAFSGVVQPGCMLEVYAKRDASGVQTAYGYIDDTQTWVPSPSPPSYSYGNLLMFMGIAEAHNTAFTAGTISITFDGGPPAFFYEPMPLTWQLPATVGGGYYFALRDGTVTTQRADYQQRTRNAMLLAPQGAAAAGSIDALLASAGGGGGITPEQYAALAKEATVLGQFGVTYGITYPSIRRDGIINLSRGDVATLTFTLGAASPLAGKKVYFCAQKRKAETNATAIVNRVATITDAAARTCSITLTAAELATAGQYHYEIEVRNTDESSPQTAEAGTLNILDDLRK